ncbi:MAG: hypothetical protein R2788_11585 [Saprospiraceae bacterium]
MKNTRPKNEKALPSIAKILMWTALGSAGLLNQWWLGTMDTGYHHGTAGGLKNVTTDDL